MERLVSSAWGKMRFISQILSINLYSVFKCHTFLVRSAITVLFVLKLRDLSRFLFKKQWGVAWDGFHDAEKDEKLKSTLSNFTRDERRNPVNVNINLRSELASYFPGKFMHKNWDGKFTIKIISPSVSFRFCLIISSQSRICFSTWRWWTCIAGVAEK